MRAGQTASIDRQQLRALLKCYFRLSMRGRVARSMGRGNKPRSLLFVLAMYVIVGLMTGFAATQLDVFTFSMLVHAMTFFVVGMAVTSESGDILFNANESDVLVHRPIHPRTLLLAKSINLIAFTLILATALNLFPAFFGSSARGARPWFPIVHLGSMILLCVFCASAVVCTYGLVIKFLDREKFDNFAAWSQVAMSILFLFGYQIVPRLLRRFEGLSFEPYARYLFPLPPAWFAGIDSGVASDHLVPAAMPLGLVGLLATTALVYLAIGRLAPSYAEGLTKLSETRSRMPKATRVRDRASTNRNPLLRWWLRDPIEWWAFRLTAAYMRRDRDIKLRLYPSLTIFLVFPILGLLDHDRGGFSAFMPLVTVWMLGMMPLQAMQTLQMSQHYLAADIFAIAPLSSAASVFHGVRKATICFLLVPALCIAALLIVYIAPGGIQALVLALPGVVALPVVSLMPAMLQEYLPLSMPATRGEQSSRNMGLMFLTMFAMAGVLAIAYISWTFEVIWYVLAVELLVSVVLYRILNRMIRNRPLARTA